MDNRPRHRLATTRHPPPGPRHGRPARGGSRALTACFKAPTGRDFRDRGGRAARRRRRAEAFPGSRCGWTRHGLDGGDVEVCRSRTRRRSGVAAAVANLDHSCDTHYPWNSADDVIVPGALEPRDGEVEVPTGPGLGLELDHDALDRLYVDSGMRGRDDTGCMHRIRPEYEARLSRW
ncbi:enolase C-terminal domain-like protein [Streptomyces sp. NPDC002845]